jgi:hypothetical protein
MRGWTCRNPDALTDRIYRGNLRRAAVADIRTCVLHRIWLHRQPLYISFAYLGLCFKKFCVSVNYLTWGRRKNMRTLSASSTRHRGGANARMHGRNRRRGRNWPDVVGRRDVQLGPRGGRPGFGRDIVGS